MKTNSETESLDESDSSASTPMFTPSSSANGQRMFRWSKFVRNLYEMAINPENGSAVGFSPDGFCLEIRECKVLSSHVLNKYFKHSNVSSFIRQLNNYGFKTVPVVMNSSVSHCFAHECFQRDRLDLLEGVKRRITGSEVQKPSIGVSEIKEREGIYEEKIAHLKRANENLAYQNAELMEENKRLRASWSSAQENFKARMWEQQQNQHRRHSLIPMQETNIAYSSVDPTQNDVFLMPNMSVLFPEDF